MPPPPPLTDALVREAESLLLGLLRNDLIGVYVIQDHVIRYANRRFAEMFGYTPDDISNQPALEQFVAPHDRERVLANVARRIRGEASTAHYTFRGKHRDGRTLEMEVFGNRTQLEGRPAIIGLMLDITARKAAEQTTVEQLHFIGQLLEAIPSPVFFKDDQARYLGCNKAFETYIGRQRGELIGRSVFDISPPELAARYHEADQQLFDHPGVQTYEASVESTDGQRKEVIFNKATWLRADGTVGGLVGVITDITDRKQTEALIWMQANYDPLTGLPNAILFNNTLHQAVVRARATGRWLALVHLDVDDFRAFNEARGSDLGNRVLVALGQRFGASLQPGELLARIAGDEFMLLLPDLGGWDDVDERIVRTLQTNRTPLEIDGESVEITFSAGIALLPADSEDGDTLVRHAQMALHQAKQEARGYFRLFDGEQDKRTHARREMLRRLDLAMENKELRLYYQPKVDMPSGRVLGFEALLRWFHPERGMVPPGEFLPVVESSDFIIRLGEWAMREALAQAVSWRRAGLETCISVNIAGRHLQLPDFPERVRHALADVPGARADSLEIEILESSILDDMAHVREVMRACAGMGVRFALDDFGTGYSSLAYLHQLPAATIKIDQFFVRNLFEQREDPAIIQAVVQIAQVFGRELVAEGVEDPEHGMLLVAMGCHIGQGFGIGRPMAAEAVLPWVAGYRARREWTALQGLAWHQGLYELFHLRHEHRQWRERVSARLAERAEAALPAFDACGLSQWLMIAAPGGAPAQVRECFRLLGELAQQARGLEAARQNPAAPATMVLLGQMFASSDALLRLLDELGVRLAARAAA